MQLKFYIGTKVLFGRECVAENKAEFGKYGKRALIVTGRYSGKASGALDDVIGVTDELGIEYMVYDRVENNPSLDNVKEGGDVARGFKADFIVGIGGGSPLDAAKAVAVLAANDIDPLELYRNSFESKPLPVLAIPTTAGTGSEVTPYSILTRKDKQTKMSFSNEDIFPKAAFLDARYTASMPYSVTVNTAVDALSHAVEGFLSKRSTAVGDILAVESIKLFGECTQSLLKNDVDFETREKLLYISMLAGMVISHTGTTIVHGMGYPLTYFKDIPHGKANGLLMEEYLKFNYDYAKGKIDKVLRLLGLKDIEEFGSIMDRLLGKDLTISEEEIDLYSSIAMEQKSTSYNIRNVAKDDMVRIYRNISLKGVS